MSILNQLLGNGSQQSASSDSSSFDGSIGTAPGLALGTGDILSFSSADASSAGDGGPESVNATEFTGIGGLGVGFGAPTQIGFSGDNMSEDASASAGGSGGLLGGLL